VILIGVFFLVWGLPCPIKYLTGIACPGCGMTRALRAVVRLDFSAAFYYHPLWILLPVLGILYFILQRKKAQRYVNLLWMVACGVMIGVYLYRLIMGPHEIVVWRPENGLIAKWIEYVRSLFLSE
jgi:hypothetical protein